MALDLVQRYNTRDLAVEVDSGARTILPGTNVFFTTDPVTGAITIDVPGATGGTVTSVGASGSTGLTIGGVNPVTTSGVITFTLSANLQAWSGVPVANKADLNSPIFTGDPRAPTPATADNDTSIATTAWVNNQGYATTAALGAYVLKAGDTMTGTLNGTNIVLSGTISADNFVDVNVNAILANNGGVGAVYLRPNGVGSSVGQLFVSSSGNLSVDGGASFANGISFGSSVASGPSDVTRHVALYGTTYGFGVTGSRLNYNAASGAGHYFRVNSVDVVNVTAANTGTSVEVAGAINTLGASAAYNFQDRTGVAADLWAWYSTGNIARLTRAGVGDRVTVNAAGDLNTGSVTTSGSVTAGTTVSDFLGEIRLVPQVILNASTSFVLSHAGRHVIKNVSTAYTYTIPTNATTAFPIGSTITVANPGSVTLNITISPAGGVTLYRNGVLGSFALAPGFMTTLLKIGTDHWMAG